MPSIPPSHHTFRAFPLSSQCDITVDVREATTSVSLHARELAVSEAKFTPAEGGEAIRAKRISLDLEATVLELEFGKELPLGAGTLSLTYIGQLNNQMAGFYRSTYTNIKGEAKVMVSTQFESIDARRAFPCWDEVRGEVESGVRVLLPVLFSFSQKCIHAFRLLSISAQHSHPTSSQPAVKAVFKLTLIVPDHMVALSNMPEEEVQSRKDGTKRFTFQPTVKMSTYLLAFAVGEFDFVQSTTKHGVVIRCFSTPGVSDRCNFALDCAVKCLDLYDDFFELPYPLPKLDMLAVPEFAAGGAEGGNAGGLSLLYLLKPDFTSHLIPPHLTSHLTSSHLISPIPPILAMENWGLVTYREVDLLIDPTTATSGQRQRVCTVVTHELAHQCTAGAKR